MRSVVQVHLGPPFLCRPRYPDQDRAWTGQSCEAVGMATEKHPLVLRIGHDELVIRKRYEVASILNDLMIAIWVIVGSFLFFSEAATYSGAWLCVVGSGQLAIRPLSRCRRHLTRRRH